MNVFGAALLAAAMAGGARAEPYLALEQGYKCVACHVNPSGGGLRNGLGVVHARTRMAAWPGPDAAQAWSGRLADWLLVGADLRWGTTRSRIAGEPAQALTGVDPLRVYADVELLPGRIGLVLDEQLRPGRPQRQEAYLRLGGADAGGYVKAGQFYLPFGWRLQDSTAFVRSLSGISMATPDKGVELGLELGDWSAQLALTRGAGNVGPVSGHQSTAQVLWTRPWGRLGGALSATTSSAGSRQAAALFGGLRTGPVVWLGELDWVRDGSFPEGRRQMLATLAELDWRIRQGHNLKLSAELLDPDRRVAEDHKVRHSLVYELTPIPFVQLRAGVRRHEGIPQSRADQRRTLFLELHLFL
jgi:hypothetical protein